MLKIAHRGNTNGPSWKENQPIYIDEALAKGFDAEIDLWMLRGKLWLGHDAAQYLVSHEWLAERSRNLWIHCKNLEALQYMAEQESQFNYFWHESDAYTLTSWDFIWAYPGQPVSNLTVIVDLENSSEYDCYGICSDYWQ
jgi:hypothetical protein